MINRRKTLKYLSSIISGFLVSYSSSCVLKNRNKKLMIAVNNNQDINPEIIQESGDFITEINRLKKLAFAKNSYLYQTPTYSELQNFSNLVKSLNIQDINNVLLQAKELNYDVVRFVDNLTKQIFYGVREKLVNGKQTRGWGSYFINPNYQSNALIEIPHVIFDKNTEELGAQVFLQASARNFLLSGAHRNANGHNSADVCNPINSIFQIVHKAWVLSETKTWQIHGFSLANQPTFPPNTQAVLSNGKGEISPEILDLSQQMQISAFKAYVYNQLPVSASLNHQVNQGIRGTVFSSLGATKNVQGIYCHQVGNAFIHIELDHNIRSRQSDRDKVAKSIALTVAR